MKETALASTAGRWQNPETMKRTLARAPCWLVLSAMLSLLTSCTPVAGKPDRGGEAPKAVAPAESAPERWTPPAPFPAPNRPRLLGLLHAKRFDELEELLDGYRAAVVAKPAAADAFKEWLLIQSYKVVGDSAPDIQMERGLWLKSHPDSYQAHTAEAFSLLDLGYQARGTAWASETPASQIESMRQLHALAADHARRALELQPNSPAPYRVLIRVTHSQGSAALLAIANESLARFPYSYNLRAHIIEGLQPRWAGSYAAMISFAEASQQFAEINPEMRTLQGFPYWARGHDDQSAGNWQAAYQDYTRALSYGDEIDFYDARIGAERELGMTGEATSDEQQEAQLFPH